MSGGQSSSSSNSSSSNSTSCSNSNSNSNSNSAPVPVSRGTPSHSSHEEMFDVLTDTGSSTGRTKARSLVHRDGDWHRAVHLWIVHISTGHLLLQQRAACKDSYPGLWDVSCAGHLSAGESSLQAAVCELQEELGISVPENTAPDQFIQYLTTLKRQQVSQGGRFIDNEWTDIYVVWGQYDLKQLKLQESEVQAVMYASPQTYIDQLKQHHSAYVPFADLNTYITRVFDVIQQQYHDKYQTHTTTTPTSTGIAT